MRSPRRWRLSDILGKAKLLGLIVDKTEIDTLRKPMREAGEVRPMTLDEWKQKFAPKRPHDG